MKKLISPQMHGVLDYLSVATLYGLPRVLAWSKPATRLLTAASLGTLGYSLLTRYELGLVKVLPMQAHLALDAASGAMLALAPVLFLDEDVDTSATLVALGLFEIGASLLTDTK